MPEPDMYKLNERINEKPETTIDSISGKMYSEPANYEVILHPNRNSNANSDLIRETSIAVSQITLPGKTLETQTEQFYGPAREVVTGETFPDVTAIVRCSVDNREKILIDDWQALAVDPEDYTIGYYEDYIGELEIFQLNRAGNRVYGVKLLECYPITVGDLTYDYGNFNSINTFSVTWKYRKYVSLNLGGQKMLKQKLTSDRHNVFRNSAGLALANRLINGPPGL
tara:strand:- start:970 stop:1647 length:678 start_codon:yes stop_codon:yes gene_type:complete